MKRTFWLILCGAALLLTGLAQAEIVPVGGGSSTCTNPASGTTSCTGSLDTPEDVFVYTFTTIAPNTDITVQTYGFGGGTNAAGAAIPAGGFDSLMALFSGPATSATILTDASGNFIASADDLINPNTGLPQFFAGCPPAGTVTIGLGGTAQSVCGDNMLKLSLAAPGTYTLLLTDAGFEAAPLATGGSYPNLDLTDTVDNYGDLTGGVFQTCDNNGDCITGSGNFAVDISTVPEPGTWASGASGVLAGAIFLYRRRRYAPPAAKAN